MTIQRKIFGFIGLIFACLVYVCFNLAQHHAQQLSGADRALEIVKLIFVSDEFLLAIQKERGLSSMYIENPNENNKNAVLQQRKNVDEIRQKRTEYISSFEKTSSNINNIFHHSREYVERQLSALNTLRAEIMDQKTTLNNAFTFYSTLVESILMSINQFNKGIAAPDIGQ
jgi:predicted PurR-regulated permease PerM